MEIMKVLCQNVVLFELFTDRNESTALANKDE